MTIVAGIDEAGYGPLLGPLVVTGVAFAVPDELAKQCLWKSLQNSVTRRPSKSDGRLPITDSKKLYSRGNGLSTLERTALVMSHVARLRADRFRSLVETLAPPLSGEMEEYPWYRGFDCDLPLANDATSIKLHANAIKKNAADQRIELLGIFCEPLLEGQFNRRVKATRNKATVALELVLRIMSRIATVAGDRTVHIHVDRQGGRVHYNEALMTAFGHRSANILSESPECSAYRLPGPRGPHYVAFHTHGEEKHLPVALASVISKYLRELLMFSLNHYWTCRVQGLKPTAGYYQDAMRYLHDIATATDVSPHDRDLLVRSR